MRGEIRMDPKVIKGEYLNSAYCGTKTPRNRRRYSNRAVLFADSVFIG